MKKTPHLRGFFIFDIMRNIVVFIIPLLLIASCSFNPNPIRSAFKKDDFLRSILKDKDKYEIQILYTEVSKNTLGQTEFKDFQFQLTARRVRPFLMVVSGDLLLLSEFAFLLEILLLDH